MAQRGKRLPVWEQDRVRRLAKAVGIKPAARAAGLSKNTVKKYVRAG
jgi:hypothetical protein